MTAPKILARMRTFVRTGYPAAAPRQGHIAALALLPPATRGTRH
ncbi:hypothetical protein ACXYX3_00600 [Mycobacterium sp. C3-094]